MQFCHRLRNLGKKIYYSPKVAVYHKNRSLKNYFFQRLTYGISAIELFKTNKSKEICLIFVPSFAVLFFLSGFMIYWYANWQYIYTPVVIVYFFFVLVEGIKYSERFYDFPGTLLALIIGNLAPALGTIAKLMRIIPNRKKIYKNTWAFFVILGWTFSSTMV